MKNQSLQDQLLNAGLTNNAKARTVKTEKRKQDKKQRKNKIEIIDEAKQLVEETKAKQLEKDKLLNEQRNQAAELKQIGQQILQLIKVNKLPQDPDGIAYNFTDQEKVKVIYISEEIRNKIISGRLAIVKARTNYEVVVAEIAQKIKQRDEQAIIVLFSENTEYTEDDDYQGYEIPDDLMW